MSPKEGDYDRPIKAGLAAEELVVEVWGGLGESTDGLIRKAAEQRANRLTHAEFEREATWATRKFAPFVMQRISVAVQIAARKSTMNMRQDPWRPRIRTFTCL